MRAAVVMETDSLVETVRGSHTDDGAIMATSLGSDHDNNWLKTTHCDRSNLI